MTAYLFIDYGDNFPAGTLSTTQGAFRDVANDPVGANRILGTPLPQNGGFSAAGQLDIIRQTFTATERAQMLAIVQRAYEPLDVTVVDLTANAQVTADGRSVAAATSMTDVINTLRAGDPNAKDAYIFVATFIADPGGPNERTYTGGGGLSPSNTLGETSDLNAAANIHDDVAVVYSDGGFSFNTVNNISHEAGHNFGLRHSITGDPATSTIALFHQLEIMSYQNTNSTSSSTFTRYPMIVGDGNTLNDGDDPIDYNLLAARNGNVTIYDQLRNDPGVGQNPNFDFITGTGAHDIITVSRNGAFIDVAVQAFANADYTGPIQVPGEADSTYSYSIAAGLPIRLYAGGSNDRVVINGDLGVDLFIDGMLGTDEIVINALGADVTYTPDPTPETSVDITGSTNVTSFGGLVIGGSSIAFNNFEATSGVSILGAGTVTYVTPGVGSDNLTVSLNGDGNPQVSGTVDDGNAVVPLEVTATRLAIQTGAANDIVTVDSSNGLVVLANGISFDGGAGFDGLNLRQTGGAPRTNGRINVGANPGDGQSIIDTQVVNFQNIEPITDNVPAATFTISSAPGIASLLDASNAINYGAAEINPAATWGRVTVDHFEPIEFINKTNLVIDAGAGSDHISLRNPNIPTGLTTISVNGGDPTASDTVVIVGTTGTDTVAFTPTGFSAATVTIATRPTVNLDAVEHVIYDAGETLGLDQLTINGTLANDVLTYDASTFDGSFRSPLSPDFDFLRSGRVTFNGGGGFDVANFLGSEGNDIVTSTANAVSLNTPGSLAILTIGAGVERLNLSTLGGSDNVSLNLNVVGLQKHIDAGDGDDIVNMSGTVDATILGGAGDDFLTGSPDYDYIDGGAGNDVIFGLAGNDDLYGGEGSDVIIGGAGADRMFGGDGADVLVWNPGDGSDLFEGGEGADILQFVGGAGVDTFTMSANGSRLRFDRQPGNIVIDAGDMEQVDVNSSISFGGILSGANNVPAVVTAASGQAIIVFNSVTNTFELQIVLQGITQANLTASSINVGAVGVNGASIFTLGAGAAWNDIGGSLRRTINLGAFPAANLNDLLTGNTYIQVNTTANANDVRAQLTPVSGAPNLNGADSFTVNDLFGTGVQVVNLGLGVADADAVDTVTINGRNVADNINLTNTTLTRVAVTGLGYDVNVDGALTAAGGGTSDILIVNGNGGDDNITSHNSLLNFFTNSNLRLNGGAGNDTIIANGASLNGGDGDDLLTGGTNNDIMDGGAGDDTFVGGGGTDNIGGGAGSSVGDTILVDGTSGADAINLSLSATGQLIATVNGLTMTYNNFVGGPIASSGIEQILVQAKNGNDGLTVNSANGAIPILITYDGGTNNDSLTLIGGTATSDTYAVGPEVNRGTSTIVIGGVTQQVSFVNIEPVIDLVAGPLVVVGTNAPNEITYTQGPNVGAPVAASGLVAVDGFETIEFGNKTVLSIHALAGNDIVTLANTAVAAPTGLTQIIVLGAAGDDLIDGSGSTVNTPLRLYGGTGNDTLIGGLGGDLLYGEQGNDILVDSPGADAFDGGNNGSVPVGFAFPALPPGVLVPAAIADPITATSGFDTIVIRGTGNNDVLAATQNAATAVAGAGYPLAIFNSAAGPGVTADVIAGLGAADVPNALASRPSVEEVRIEAGHGNDEIIVGHADAYVAASGTGAAPVLAAGAVPQQMVRFDVRGDSPNASDRLTIQDLGFGDLVLLRQALDQRTGRVTVAPAVNTTTLGGFFGDVVYTGIEKVNITPINPLNGATGTNGLGQVIVFDTDPFEYNDNILNAEDFAHIELVTRSPNIDPGHNAAIPVVTPAGNGDEDWYAFTADQNGTFTINTLFSAVPVAQPTIPGTRPGLPGNGMLTSALYNAIGAATAPLVVGSPLLSPQGNLIGQQLQFTGVEGVTYYLRIVGQNTTPNGLPAVGSVSTSLSVNTYDLTLAQIDNLGPQVIDPDGPLFPAQAIQIVDSPLYNLFDNKQVFNSSVAAAPAPTLVGGVLSFTASENLVGLRIGETVTFTTGVNAGLSASVTGINGNRLQFGSAANPTILALPAVGDAFFVGAATPTPNVHGLTINFRDPISASQFGLAPGTLLGALDPATALNPGNYILRGDANGIIPIQNVRFAVPSTGVIGGAVLAAVPTALNTTISLNAGAGLSVANGPIVGQTLQFTTGPNTGLFGRITGYNATTGSLRFSSPFPVAIAAGNAFIISPSPIVISPVPVLATANVTAASTNIVINLGAGGVTGAGLSNVVGTYVGQALQIISGPLAGETRTITAYNGAGVFTVAAAVIANGYSAAPAIGTTFNIVGTPVTATSAVVAGPPLTSVSFNGGAALPAVNNSFIGQALQFTSGTLSGQARVITGYSGATRTFTFAAGFTGAPAIGDQFTVVPNAPAATSGAVVVPGTLTLTANAAGLSAVPGAYVGQILQITSGALTGQAQLVNGYNGAGVFTFANPFGAGMAAGDTFNVLPVNVTAITLDFERALPDDRFTLTVSDEIRDFAGNQLDGNSNASQPTGSPIFPSGDGISGGDFVARFTVDSRPELGTWAAGSMWADINGNQLFDPNNADFTNRDFAYLLGYTSDELFAGNFADVSGTFADGFDKIAAYGRVGNQWRWLIDTDNDGVPNIQQVDPAGINGFPVSGDFAPALPGDEVGLFTGTTWFLDIDGDFNLNDGALGVRQLGWTRFGVQVIGHGFTGDFDGDGAVDLGTWSNDLFSLSLSSLSGGVADGVIDVQFSFGFPGNRERPVAADMNGDGIDDIGLWTPDRATQIDGQAGEWYWLVSGIVTNDTPAPGGLPPFPATLGPTIPQRVVADPITAGRNIVAFTPTPFGNDLYMQFGDEFSLPIVGNFDPPVGQPTTHGLTNPRNSLDIDNDGLITALDALAVINQLNISVIPVVPQGGFLRAPFLDVDGDSSVTALDALAIINWLNSNPVDSNGVSFASESAGEETGFDEELLILLALEQNERDHD